MFAAARTVGGDPHRPAAVFHGNRVLVCSSAARESGVRRGMRRRTAQGRCPELVVYGSDPDRDARFFEPVAQAVEAIATGVEIIRPGLVAVPVRGPARYFGSEESVAERVLDEVEAHVDAEPRVGVADGLFAAILAARRTMVVPPGGDAAFLAPLPIGELGQFTGQEGPDAGPGDGGADSLSGWVDLLSRLGIVTLGEFAALPESDVSSRFGAAAVPVHRAANGRAQRPPQRRAPAAELAVMQQYEPTLDRVDEVAFAAKELADRLHAVLRGDGVACVRLGIAARTASGEQLYRVWRCAEPLSATGTADRVRWQLDGWLTGRGTDPAPSAGVRDLELRPEELIAAGKLQFDLLDPTAGRADDRAERALTRVLGMLGPNAVLTGVLDGGRDVRDRVRWVPWGEPRRSELAGTAPWPGRIPPPSPSVVPAESWLVTVSDDSGKPVELDDRGWLSAAPHQVAFRSRSRQVSAWAGPWPIAERWWAALGRSGVGAVSAHAPVRVGARMQVVLAASSPGANEAATGDMEGGAESLALLLSWENAEWRVVGTYR